jgi:hypothetical protein
MQSQSPLRLWWVPVAVTPVAQAARAQVGDGRGCTQVVGRRRNQVCWAMTHPAVLLIR